MPSLIYSEAALADLERLATFRSDESTEAGLEVVRLILDAADILIDHPLMGRRGDPPHRELVISHGRSGYIALYHIDEPRNRVGVDAIRHQHEAGFND